MGGGAAVAVERGAGSTSGGFYYSMPRFIQFSREGRKEGDTSTVQ